MRKIVFLLMLLTAMFGAVVPFHLQTPYYSLASPLKRFSSYDELRDFVEARSQPSYHVDLREGGDLLALYGLGSSKSLSEAPDYSTTNIQVEGIDEADVVKTDGEYLYIVSGRNVTILKAYPAEEAMVLSQIRLNGTVQGIFINGDRIGVFEGIGSGSYSVFRRYGAARTSVKVYDVVDRESPVLRREVSLNGSYFNSRMIDNYIYTVIMQPASYIENEVSLPIIQSGVDTETIQASEIYYSDVPDQYYAFTTILTVDVLNDEEEPTYKAFLLGATSGMYVSLDNIYITFPQGENTHIHRFRIGGGETTSAADGEVSGHVLNQFSMDEYGGYFRVATTTGHVARSWTQASSQNHVYVLDLNLTVVGRLEGLAPGEDIHSARFMGDRCYLVTFKKTDPLFVIDLEDPYTPAVLGKLKIPGYSDYLHPYDENHLIGVGKETVEAEEGDFAWYQGVKISLFDVSDIENPTEMTKYEIGDRGTESPALSDHKAFLFERSKNLLVLPVLVAEIDEEKYPNGFLGRRNRVQGGNHPHGK